MKTAVIFLIAVISLLIILRFTIFKKATIQQLLLPLLITVIVSFTLIVIVLLSDDLYKLIFNDQTSKTGQTASYSIDGGGDTSIIKIADDVLIDAPIIDQFPELPRGCEVTSLAMLLQHVNVDVDKMTLAEQVKKDPAEYQVEGGKIHFGNPYYGFVGNMYTFDKPGLGVYHNPIRELAEQYLPDQIIDLTGGEFEELKVHLSDGRPVWVIINTGYQKLPNSYFQTWQTAQGTIEITYKEHSVLVTGYDDEYVYFNDPLIAKKNRREPIDGFIDAWIQMGRQAITYLPQNNN